MAQNVLPKLLEACEAAFDSEVSPGAYDVAWWTSRIVCKSTGTAGHLLTMTGVTKFRIPSIAGFDSER
jgi:hypothetical protein